MCRSTYSLSTHQLLRASGPRKSVLSKVKQFLFWKVIFTMEAVRVYCEWLWSQFQLEISQLSVSIEEHYASRRICLWIERWAEEACARRTSWKWRCEKSFDQGDARLDYGQSADRKVSDGLKVHLAVSEVPKVQHSHGAGGVREIFGVPWRRLRTRLVLQPGLRQARRAASAGEWPGDGSRESRQIGPKSSSLPSRSDRSEDSNDRQWRFDLVDDVLRDAARWRGESDSRTFIHRRCVRRTLESIANLLHRYDVQVRKERRGDYARSLLISRLIIRIYFRKRAPLDTRTSASWTFIRHCSS